MKRFLLLVAAGCGTTEQAETVELPVTTAASPIAAASTDLGYEVRVDSMRVAVTGIQFTIEGEQHEGSLVAPHPGHSSGGEVTGELAGNFVLAWTGQAQPTLGMATLIAGDYHGANFSIRAADASDVAAGDPLLGHAFHLTGTISRAGTTRPFDATLDVEPDTNVIGLPFEATITGRSTETLAIDFAALDAFDGIDFFAESATGSIAIRPGSTPHNLIRRAIQTHDHYGVTAR